MAELTNINPQFVINQRIDDSIYESIELSVHNQCLELDNKFYRVVIKDEKNRHKLLKNIKPYKNEEIFFNLQHNTICVWVIFSLYDKVSSQYITSHIYALPASIHEHVSKHFHLVYKIYEEFKQDCFIDLNYAGELKVMNSNSQNRPPHILYNCMSGSYMATEFSGKTDEEIHMMYDQIHDFMNNHINSTINYILLAETIISPEHMRLTNEYLQQLLIDGFSLLRFNSSNDCLLYESNKFKIAKFISQRNISLIGAKRIHDRFNKSGEPFDEEAFIEKYNADKKLDSLTSYDKGEEVTINMLRQNTHTRQRQRQTRNKRKFNNKGGNKKNTRKNKSK